MKQIDESYEKSACVLSAQRFPERCRQRRNRRREQRRALFGNERRLGRVSIQLDGMCALDGFDVLDQHDGGRSVLLREVQELSYRRDRRSNGDLDQHRYVAARPCAQPHYLDREDGRSSTKLKPAGWALMTYTSLAARGAKACYGTATQQPKRALGQFWDTPPVTWRDIE